MDARRVDPTGSEPVNQVERVAFTGAAEAWLPRLEATCRTFVADRTGVVAVGNVTAAGPAISTPLTRAGLLVLFDGGLEVWHRLAVLDQDPVHRYARLDSNSLTVAEVVEGGEQVELQLAGPSGLLLLVVVRPGTAALGEATAALRRWVAREQRAAATAAAPTASVTTLHGDEDVLAVLERFRGIVDAAFGEVAERLASQQAELERLRRREAELTQALAGRHSGRAS
jgi:hypothetical protein